MMRIVSAVLISTAFLGAQAAKAPTPSSNPLQVKTLLETDKAWDGNQYTAYPAGHPQLSVLQITIPPNTTMEWHRHSVPNAAYVVSGELAVQKQNSHSRHFTKGQVIAETVGEWHRGVTGNQAADLLVFYAGAPGVPLSEPQPKPSAK